MFIFINEEKKNTGLTFISKKSFNNNFNPFYRKENQWGKQETVVITFYHHILEKIF